MNSVFNVAAEAAYSPYMLARAVLQARVPDQHNVAAVKAQVKNTLRNLALVDDDFLRGEIELAQCVDRHYSPHMDMLRHDLGLENEFRLQRHLQALGVAFETERELEARGFPKTPDVRLPVPIGLETETGEVEAVHWIDSKAMFGLRGEANENVEQLKGYVNRFGPGMVIYWMGFHPDLLIPHVAIRDRFPDNVVLLS